MFSFFQQNTKPKTYVPDSIYTVCTSNECDVCSNDVWNPVVNGMVHDSQNGKVFCPFGKGESMNASIFESQIYLNELNKPKATTWGRAPQLDPRPLARIGLEWRTN